MTTRSVRTFWWNEAANFGDAMNPLLLQRLFDVEATWTDLATAELTAAGSVIQWITPCESSMTQPLHVWGSGYIFGEEPAPSPAQVSYAAVRGTHSAKMSGLGDDVAHGDPGLLASLVVDRPKRRHKIGFVPHLWHRDNALVRDLVAQSSALFIDVADEPAEVIAQISSCDFIFSSSLHGLVIADSYGIPNCWFTIDRPLFGDTWKFDDYYSAFGLTREVQRLTADIPIDRVMDTGAADYYRPGLAQLQEGLLSSFPFRP